jgi:prepilin-type N-terminal cleavage/methylation domain-containing protein
MTPTNCRRRAFTFVEVLAALLILSVVAPIFVEAMLVSSRAGVIAERKRTATQLAERQLRTSIIEDTWRDGTLSGDFGTDWSDYSWKITTEDWSITTATGTQTSDMTLMTIAVTYKVEGSNHEVTLQTLIPTSATSSSSSSSTSSSS